MAQTNNVLRRLYIATALCTFFLIVEAVGGYVSNSIAILSDAAHLFADLASFGVAIFATHIAHLPSTSNHTYGLKRMESMAALLSMVSLALVSVGLAYEAVSRLFFCTHNSVDGPLMSGIASLGVFVNVVLAVVLGPEHHVHLPGASDHDHSHHHHHHDDHPTGCSSSSALPVSNHDHPTHHDNNGHDHTHDNEENDHVNHDHCHTHHDEEQQHGNRDSHEHHEETPLLLLDQPITPRNVNLQAAYLHVMGDLAQSVGVLLAGLAIWINPKLTMVDPICTLFFCAIVFYSTLSVIRRSLSVLLEAVPHNIDWKSVHRDLNTIPGVVNVHDLHIWSISDGVPALSAHCFSQNTDKAICDVFDVCCSKHNIHHVTIQVQRLGDDCNTCNDTHKNCVSHEEPC